MAGPANSINLNSSSYGVVSFDGVRVFNTIVPGTNGNVLTSNAGVWVSSPISSIGAITQITGNSGGAQVPSGGNFNLLGGTTGLTFAGSAATETLTGTLVLANGGTSASLTASNGGIFYSTASAGAILSGTATAGQIIRSGASSAPSWSTATYPATAGTSGNVLTSNGTNWSSAAPAASSISLTGDSGGALTGAAFTFNAASQAGGTVSFSGSGSTISLNVTSGGSTFNTVMGLGAGAAALGVGDTGFGAGALAVCTGNGNTAFGYNSLPNVTTGVSNTAIGQSSGTGCVTGSRGVYLGINSSSTSHSDCFSVNSAITSSNQCRIGAGTGTGSYQLNNTFICGINGVTASNPALVTINTSTDQLGTTVTPSLTSVTFPTAGGSGTATSDTMSYYEEGTWVPVLDGAVSGTTTYTTQQGYYTKIGNMVFVSALIIITSATGTGNAIFSGLPFTVKNQSGYAPRGTANLNSSAWAWPASTTNLFWQLTANSTSSGISGQGSTIASSPLQMTNGAATITLNGFYQV